MRKRGGYRTPVHQHSRPYKSREHQNYPPKLPSRTYNAVERGLKRFEQEFKQHRFAPEKQLSPEEIIVSQALEILQKPGRMDIGKLVFSILLSPHLSDIYRINCALRKYVVNSQNPANDIYEYFRQKETA